MMERISSEDSRRELVESGFAEHGYDFYIVDSREFHYPKAAPFRIANEKDRMVFINFASPFIPWAVLKNAAPKKGNI